MSSVRCESGQVDSNRQARFLQEHNLMDVGTGVLTYRRLTLSYEAYIPRSFLIVRMSRLVEETVHAQLGPGPLERSPDGIITHCIAHVLYAQAPADDVVWDLIINFSPNIIRPTTCVCASVCVANSSKSSVLPDPRICPQIFSVTCLPDQVVIRGSIGKSPMSLELMLNMMICNRN